ncbi:MAG: hypothetical protein ACFFC7_32195 [Candidatus Hermodarchaeota archaeon]
MLLLKLDRLTLIDLTPLYDGLWTVLGVILVFGFIAYLGDLLISLVDKLTR